MMKFKYQDKVEITGGFYSGHTGTVVNYIPKVGFIGWLSFSDDKEYQVQLDGDYSKHPYIEEKHLKKVDNGE
jgi:hypothetical protein